MVYGFIGAGNIATAIITGLIKNQVAQASEIAIYDKNGEQQNKIASKYGLTEAKDEIQIVTMSDVVFLAVKPHNLEEVLEKIACEANEKNVLLVSLAAGKSISFIEETLGFPSYIIRVMPNVNAMVGESVSGVCPNSLAKPEHIDRVRRCLEAIGVVYECREEALPVYTALCASGPAFAYLFTETLAKAAHKAGVSKETALRLAAHMVRGSQKMLLESGEHPWNLIDKVCSPGGMTIEGICKLAETGFESSLLTAMEATINKDKKL